MFGTGTPPSTSESTTEANRAWARPFDAQSPDTAVRSVSRIGVLAAVTIVTVLVLAGGMSWQFFSGESGSRFHLAGEAVAPATFVGSETCAGCHDAEAKLWRGSQHRHAMDHATDGSVLGDFNEARFDYYGVRSRFFRKTESSSSRPTDRTASWRSSR